MNNTMNQKPEDCNAVVCSRQGPPLTPSRASTQTVVSAAGRSAKVLPITRSLNVIPLTLSLSNQQIPLVEHFKYLGVTISRNLSWSQHITNTVRSSKQQLGLLHRKLKDASQQSKLKIYRSTVLPKLEYCAAVWDPHQSTLTKQLENTQSLL